MSSSVTSNVFPILYLPAELRVMIFQYLCTATEQDRTSTKHQLGMLFAIKILSESGGPNVRSELISAFFTKKLPTAQVHIGPGDAIYPPCPSGSPRSIWWSPEISAMNREIFNVLQSSSLFTKYIQHISLAWDGCYCLQAAKYGTRQVRATGLDWLAKCENLKTLEVIITHSRSARRLADGSDDGSDDGMDGRRPWDVEFCQRCRRQLVSVSKTLEKVKFRMFIRGRMRWEDEIVHIKPGWEVGLANCFWRERGWVLEEEGVHDAARRAGHQTVWRMEEHMGAVEVGVFLEDTI